MRRSFACTARPTSCSTRSTAFPKVIVLLLIAVIGVLCATKAEGSNSAALTISGSLPNGNVDQAYNAVLVVSGGARPYQFSVAAGSLPPGITLDRSTGSLKGTPTAAGTYTFQIDVTDVDAAARGSQTFVLRVEDVDNAHRRNPEVKVGVTPSTTTIAAGALLQLTATVTGTAETAINWSASSGSINSNGLFTAPATKADVTIIARSVAKPDKFAKAIIAVNPQQSQPLQITTTSVPQGQIGNVYTSGLTATGGTGPYSWSVSSGTVPTGLVVGADGSIAGTPLVKGKFPFSIAVTDAKNNAATSNLTMNVSESGGYDGPAELPLVTMPVLMADTPAPGSVITVNAGGDLQAALNQVQCGQTIQLQAGATFSSPVGQYHVQAKNCDANHWIIIRTSAPDSALPAEGTRLTPCYAGVASLVGRPAYNCPNPQNVTAKVQMVNPTDGPFYLEQGANFYRFIGLEMTRPAGTPGPAKLMLILGTADHIIVDRCWLHGQPQDETYGGFGAAGGTNIALIDSYLNDFHCISNTGACTDSHVIAAGTSTTQEGPFLIQDNFLEASGEEILFGGGPATTTPADITIQQNHFWKPWQWMPGSPNFVGGADGNPFIVKNHLELKNAQRVLIQGNLMENNWGGFSQHGFAVLLNAVNQYSRRTHQNLCPLCMVTDVTIRYCHISHAAGGIGFATELSPATIGSPAALGTRFSLHDDVIDGLSAQLVGNGVAFGFSNGWPKNALNTITINHVTAFSDPNSHLMTIGNRLKDAEMYGFVFTNNLVQAGAHPIWDQFGAPAGPTCAQSDLPLGVLQACFTSYTFSNNGIIATPSPYPPSVWPTGNFFPSSASAVEFTNFKNGNGGNYQLQSSSPYLNKGTDGKPLGADIVGLQQQLANVE